MTYELDETQRRTRSTQSETLQTVIDALEPLDVAERERVLRTVVTFFGVSTHGTDRSEGFEDDRGMGRMRPFVDKEAVDPKEFLFEKAPNTDIDRVACLAYYLTHYRDQPHFRTLDISKLNTEAAQVKFSNAAFAVQNATTAGLLAPATKGNKQLSAIGERYVAALPDREQARALLAAAKRKRAKKTRRETEASDE